MSGFSAHANLPAALVAYLGSLKQLDGRSGGRE